MAGRTSDESGLRVSSSRGGWRRFAADFVELPIMNYALKAEAL